MPIYNYECKECGNKIESIEKMGTDSKTCVCGAVAKKVQSLTNFVLADGGCGWARNGYSKQGNKKK